MKWGGVLETLPLYRLLTYFRTSDMDFHMKTTLIISDDLFRRLKRNAAETRQTLSSVVEELLRKGLAQSSRQKRLPKLPTFDAGRPLVNMADRNELYYVMESDRDNKLYRAKKDR